MYIICTEQKLHVRTKTSSKILCTTGVDHQATTCTCTPLNITTGLDKKERILNTVKERKKMLVEETIVLEVGTIPNLKKVRKVLTQDHFNIHLVDHREKYSIKKM